LNLFEAERRLDEYLAGGVAARDAGEVLVRYPER